MKHLELRIRDERAGMSGALIQFSSLLRALAKVVGNALSGEWEVFRGACGYGEQVCALEAALTAKDSTVVEGKNLLPALLSDVEYFDNVRIRLKEVDVEFGIHDNTFHFVKGDARLLEQIATEFKTTEIVS